MKNILYRLIAFIFVLQLISCDKIENPYPKQYVDIDTTLIYGMTLKQYKASLWKDFDPNTNTNANVLIEDFTGHKCVNCPYAAVEAHNIEGLHPDRVFVASIHAGNNGSTYFQNYQYAPFTTNFTNADGLAISVAKTDGGFIGNPSGTNNRKKFGGFIFQNYSSWSSNVNSILNENQLKVNLQAFTNYFPQTKGVILHTEIDPISTIEHDLYQVVYVIEDSLIAPQIVPAAYNKPNNIDSNYVHRDIMRGCIDGKPLGQKLTSNKQVDKYGKTVSGDKYYLNYSYKIPDQYNKDNLHFLIFVYDAFTDEILQVIRKNIE